MKKRNNNPFEDQVLDKEEELLEKSLEEGNLEESSDLEDTKKMLQEAASRYMELHNSKPITIRVNLLDLIKIKTKAKKKQIPYQTLLGALLHDFAEGEKELRIQ